HVSSTGSIGAFKILSEAGIASGVRRIEAITGNAVFAYYREMENKLKAAAEMLKTRPADICERISTVLKENKELSAEIASLKSKAAGDALGNVADDVKEASGIKYVIKSVEGVDMNALRELGDKIKDGQGCGIVVLGSVVDGKVNLIAMASDDAVKKGAHAGNLIKAIASCVGGGGGGKPNMAQAGGKNPAGMADALAAADEAVLKQLNA
ncbi:MAG: alanine--tRNA ligase, partial [Lachnospiraceae bacterium]|nr:alanine--tRNA ligase [Lachnospiraceae bacterium]